MTDSTDPTGADVLAVPLTDNARAECGHGATTVRDYLVALLRQLWREGEGFSGKRPFGNSGWEYDLYDSLGRAGLIRAKFDDDGYVDDVDTRAGDRLIAAAIDALGTD